MLDLSLPDVDGLKVCHRIRAWGSVPIVVLSADRTEDRKVSALEGGADDHMTKPFGMRELNARLGGALRHGQAAEGADGAAATLEVGPDSLDITRYQATYGGQPLELTPKEFEFLAYLARNGGKVCTRRMILENV